ncbi:MAG: DUF362 domain-containing protein [Methanoregulaceae archaeon]|nr:DUF362 domain-containing protein [Methanoregulaceae archaeon]
MSRDVYFAGLKARDPCQSSVAKIRSLFEAAGFGECIDADTPVAVKIHFGEPGNDSYVNPVFARQVVDKIREHGGKPFLTDSNTLYRGNRSNAVDHIITALEHGFSYATVAAPILIADGISGKNYREVMIGKRHFDRVLVSGDIADVKSVLVLTHFKGHEAAGFGGAIKNLAMGCAPPAGKQEQHSARPLVIEERCIGCGKCLTVCPPDATSLVEGKSVIDKELCTGCFECMTVCPERAIDLDWETEIPLFTERMVEYAYGAALGKKTGYINFLTQITPDCDCVPWSDAPIVPDIGFLASRDPVAIDAASFDLVNRQQGLRESALTANLKEGEDKFQGLRKRTDGYRQIRYAEEIGLGTGAYRLIELQ